MRRTAPLRALTVGTPAFVVDAGLGSPLGTVIIFTDLLYAASLYGPRAAGRWLTGVTGVASLGLAGTAMVLSRSLSALVVTAAILAVTLVTPVLTGLLVRQHRDRAEVEQMRAEQVAKLAELDRQTAVTAERARMARELHDVIANHLGAAALHATAALRLSDMDPDRVRHALIVIRDSSVQGLADVADLVAKTVRPDLAARLTVRGNPPGTVPAAVELAAYRIVQESLTNVLKHAGPGTAEVVVGYRPDRTELTVDSPLGGQDTQVPGAGHGLVGMRERASLLGGGFHAGPREDRWRVHAELPLGDALAGKDSGKDRTP